MHIPKNAEEYKPGMIINTNNAIDGYGKVISREEYKDITGQEIPETNSYFDNFIFYTELNNNLTLSRKISMYGQNPVLFKSKKEALSNLEKRIKEAQKIRELILSSK